MNMERIGVLMGGISCEREISLRSGQAVFEALQSADMDVVALDMQEENWPEQLADGGLDKVFIALHGRWGEDGCVQGLLEIMGIPYTGSGVTASALCMHKPLCKAVLNQAGLKTAVDIALSEKGPARYPVILKPASGGSSVGLHLLNNEQDWRGLSLLHEDTWMAELPVHGVEVAVSVLNGRPLPPVEIVPASGVYDYHSKYTKGATTYICPAGLPAETLKRCMQCAQEAVRITDCRGAPRVDMIVADGGEPVILEINTIPGMTETSLLPKAAAAAGIDFTSLCMVMLKTAMLDGLAEVA